MRGNIAPIRDDRGVVISAIANLQAFLTAARVDQLVDDYLAGLSVGQLAHQHGVHRATVSSHLTRGVARRLPGLAEEDAAEAIKLYRSGVSMRAISRTLGVDRRSVRRVLVAFAPGWREIKAYVSHR